MSRPDGLQTFPLPALRKTLSYDENLGGPSLTVIGNILPQSPKLRLSPLPKPLF